MNLIRRFRSARVDGTMYDPLTIKDTKRKKQVNDRKACALRSLREGLSAAVDLATDRARAAFGQRFHSVPSPFLDGTPLFRTSSRTSVDWHDFCCLFGRGYTGMGSVYSVKAGRTRGDITKRLTDVLRFR